MTERRNGTVLRKMLFILFVVVLVPCVSLARDFYVDNVCILFKDHYTMVEVTKDLRFGDRRPLFKALAEERAVIVPEGEKIEILEVSRDFFTAFTQRQKGVWCSMAPLCIKLKKGETAESIIKRTNGQ